MNLSLINQKNEEIQQKLIEELINIKFKENMWQLNCIMLFFFSD